MNQDLYDWLLLLFRWLHIVTAVSWIGTSVFFMWLDRSFEKNENSTRDGHIGEAWMVHGGGFYHVEKLMMGPTKVPRNLHWFKWEAYWTWMSGIILVGLVYYAGNGTYLLDETISEINFYQGLGIALGSIFVSWIFYDRLWESELTKNSPRVGHVLTVFWFVGVTYFLCHTLSGRAAYIHVGAMLGTWMVGNVLMRIIPRQVKMVEASKKGEPVNQEWGKNAKNRSTHNTYFTLPVIFIMVSNHFPSTYGHENNWLVLIMVTLAGACIREYFVTRLSKPWTAAQILLFGIILIIGTISYTKTSDDEGSFEPVAHEHVHVAPKVNKKIEKLEEPEKIKVVNEKVKVVAEKKVVDSRLYNLNGVISFEGEIPKGKKLQLPKACSKQHKGQVFSNEVIVDNGKLKNVLVRITKGLEGKSYDKSIPKEVVEVDQKGCLYVPRVNGVRVGQEVVFINSDPIFHNVKSVTKNNKRFNFGMPKKGQRNSLVFKKPEIFLKTKCSVHPWMGAYIAIVEHPFFGISDKKGTYEIKNLPSGRYTIEFWHEVFGTITKEIDLTNGIVDSVNVTFRNKE